jgi:3-hydroxyisobutyrate dehydrogenase-like beta-hydroxyacid dehydrogenase
MQTIIGIVGTGLMGSAIARRLADAGFGVLAWDRDPASLEAISSAQRAADASEVFAKCERIVLCLPESTAVASVLRDHALRADQIIVDTSTGSPEAPQTFAASAAAQGAHFLDATISGSSAQVLDGSCIVMAGGSREAFDLCRDIFAAFSSQAFHTGARGTGAKMKLATNLVLG